MPESFSNLKRKDFIKISVLALFNSILIGENGSGNDNEIINNYLASVIDSLKSKFNLDEKINSGAWGRVVLHCLKNTNFSLNSLHEENSSIEEKEKELKQKISIILTIILKESRFTEKNLFDQETFGPMQVSLRYVLEENPALKQGKIEEIKDYLSTKEGGVFYGVKYLAKIAEIYLNLKDEDLKIKCIFADYNAGAFASRNTAIQRFLNNKYKANLVEDGLIREQTKNFLKDFFIQNGISIEQYEKDFKKGALSDLRLAETECWKKMEEVNGGPLLPVVPETPLDDGKLKICIKKIFGVQKNSKEYANISFSYYSDIIRILDQVQIQN